MINSNKARTFLINLMYAFSAQLISFLIGVLLSLFIPKIIGVEEYGYWQLFIFYTSYVGAALFGLQDGIYLRYGGTPYDKLDKSLMGSELKLSLVILIFFSVLLSVYAILFEANTERQFVIIESAVFLVIFDLSTFLNYIFQVVNKTKYYSISVIVSRLTFIVFILVILINGLSTYRVLVIAYCVSQFISLLYCFYRAKEILFSELCKFKVLFADVLKNIRVGIKLTVSNIAGMLIIGGSRFIIDRAWGIETFAKASLSITITNFFLSFIGQVSIVLFPALRQSGGDKSKKIFIHTKNILGLLLCGVFLCYLPLKYVLGLWLPQYKESFEYLALMLPICVFDGKMQLLLNTYLKVLRKEKQLLYINLLTFLINIILSIIAVKVFGSIYSVIMFMVVAIIFRSVISEIYLEKQLNIKLGKNIFLEVLLVLIFLLSVLCFKPLISFSVYLVSYVICMFVSRNELYTCVKEMMRVFKK